MGELPVPLGLHKQHDALLASLDLSATKPPSLPVPNPTKSLWLDIDDDLNPFAKAGSTGPLTTETDVCIIGSGGTGVSAAYHLTQLFRNVERPDGPIRITILEARDFCSGATGRNGGHLTPISFAGFSAVEAAHGTKNAVANAALEEYVSSEIQRLSHEYGWTDDIDLVINKRTILLLSEDEEAAVRNDFNRAQAAGLPLLEKVEWFSKEEVEKQFGASYPAIRKPGNNVWPLKLFAKLYQKAQDDSGNNVLLNMHTSTPVHSISPVSHSQAGNGSASANRWRLRTSRGDVSCRYIIHATNGYASYLLPHLTGPKGIVSTRGQIIATRSSAPSSEITDSGWIANSGFEYWFPRPTKSPDEKPLIILGGAREVEGNFEFYETDDSIIVESVGKSIRDFLPYIFPGKFDYPKVPEMEWTGILGFTAVGDPFVGPVLDPCAPGNQRFEGQYIAAGYTGHGMPRTYACAEVVARMVFADVCGKPSEWERPHWLPDQYLTTNRV